MKSTVPGLAAFPPRESKFKTPHEFLEYRKEIDGAEGLWRIRNGLYDLEKFIKTHPGGPEWLQLTRGTDITELFESHHLTDKAGQLLPKFYVRDAKDPRKIPFTFSPDGFYCKFRKRAVEALKNVNIHKPSARTNAIADFLLVASIIGCLLATVTKSWLACLITGLLLTWVAGIAHNYVHMRDSFRMYYMDLTLMSSRDWRITHIMSHHMYTNTVWDHEMYAVEPYMQWIPGSNKSILAGLRGLVFTPVAYILLTLMQGVKRYYGSIFHYGRLEFRDYIPFLLPLMMTIVSPSLLSALQTWITIVLINGFTFGYVGFNAAHHHPDIFHDGDRYRDNLDWGLLELDAVRDRKVIDESLFLALTNFGSHSLHHLLPTIDHAYLPLCLPAFRETCKEFGIDYEQWSYTELVKGQFQQLLRSEIRKSTR